MNVLDNDIKILKRAQMFMERLSHGVDPISGNDLPNDTVIHNERISKCFSYVADVLGLLIDHGGIAALSGANRKPEISQNVALQPFRLSPAQRQSVVVFDKPLDISTFTRNINRVIDAGSMQKLKGTAFATWLFRKGFIERDGSTRKPTPTGVSLGITTQTKQTNQLIYSREAQQFLLDNIDEIIAVSNGGVATATASCCLYPCDISLRGERTCNSK